MSSLHVVFRVGPAEYVIPAEDVLQMETFNGATPVPGSHPHVAGIVQVRGKVVPAIDARARFGLPPADRTLDTRLLVARTSDRTVALIVDQAREVLKLSPENFRPPPPMLQAEARGLVKAVAQLGNRIVMLLDFNKVVNEGDTSGE